MNASPDQLFGQAVSFHQQGNLAAAEHGYRQVLAVAPRHADSLHMLGRLALQAGQPAESIELIEHALRLQPRTAAFHDSRGQALKALGRLDEAIEAYQKAVRIDQRSFGYRYDLGNALLAASRFEEAAQCLRRALAIKADFAGAHNNLGIAYRRLGKPKEAAAAFGVAVRLDPAKTEFQFNLGAALAADKNFTEAEPYLAEVVRREPDHRLAWSEFAAVRRALEDWAGAVPCYEMAMRLFPDDAKFPNELADVLFQLNRFEDAEAALRIMLRLKPDSAFAWSKLANLQHIFGRLDEAGAYFAEALRHDPDLVSAHYFRALLHLAMGRFAEGWPEWEWRWQTFNKTPPFPTPLWIGEPMAGRTLFIYGEQGYGDFIQFCRFIPLAARRARVILQVSKTLDRLLRSLPGEREVVVLEDPSGSPAFDAHVPVLSLARALGITLENLPSEPYLHAEPDLVEAWHARVAPLPGLRVGLAWAGNDKYGNDRHRSLSGEQLGALACIPGVSFVSLQIGGSDWTKPSDEVRAALNLFDPTAALDDFADTAALIATLDLVVSVDTATAHLAGALGGPVWLLNRFDTDWRWMHDRTDSPWYPSMRIFRQQSPGDWAPVIAELRRELAALAATGARTATAS